MSEKEQTTERRNFEWKSQSVLKLAQSLLKFQGEAFGIKKTKKNPFYNSTYADINVILKEVMPLLVKYGLCITQGNNFCAKTNGFFVTTTLLHESGEWLRSEVFIPLGKNPNAQSAGSACTYGRRYGLAGMLGIVLDEDDDANSISPKQTNDDDEF